jgi:hypothetical protein
MVDERVNGRVEKTFSPALSRTTLCVIIKNAAKIKLTARKSMFNPIDKVKT